MNPISRLIRNTFIPTLQNNLKPYAFRPVSLVVVFIVFACAEIALFVIIDVLFRADPVFTSVLPQTVIEKIVSIVPKAIINDTNMKRQEQHLAALQTSVLLDAASDLKAKDMSARGYFSHKGPDGEMPWSWMKDVGYPYMYAGENLAVGFYQSQDVVNAWMKSPAHKENLLNPDFRDIGVSVEKTTYKGKKTAFVVQFFGTQVGQESEFAAQSAATGNPSSLASIGAIEGILTSSVSSVRFVIIILSLLLIVVVMISAISTYMHHRSSDTSLKIREILILYKTHLIITIIAVVMMMSALIVNSLLTSGGSVTPDDGSYASVLE